MKRNRSAKNCGAEAGSGSVGRRSFLRKAGLGSVGALALAGLGDVLASPAASASSRNAVSQKHQGQITLLDKKNARPNICSGESICYPCNGCCGHPCTPRGVGYCFYCSGSCGQGVYCFDHPPQKFTNCCH